MKWLLIIPSLTYTSPMVTRSYSINKHYSEAHLATENEHKLIPSGKENTPPSQTRLTLKYGEGYLNKTNILTIFIPTEGKESSLSNLFVSQLGNSTMFIKTIHDRDGPEHEKAHYGIDKSRNDFHHHLQLAPSATHEEIKEYLRKCENEVMIEDCLPRTTQDARLMYNALKELESFDDL